MNQGNLEKKVHAFIVCGVCGCGKTTIAARCSKYFNCEFIEGDDLHPVFNVEMMKKGQALTDENRWPWLEQISKTIKLKSTNLISSNESERKLFVSCSALKRAYRERIERSLKENVIVVWVYLKIEDKDKLKQRLRERKGHFMSENLVQSQFEALEPPNAELERVIEQSVEDRSVDEIVKELIQLISNFK